MVDVTLVEGAVSSDEDLHKIQKIRAHTKILVSLGDCAVTAQRAVACAIRSRLEAIMDRAYLENADLQPQMPTRDRHAHAAATGAARARDREGGRVHPGCPPPADAIYYVAVANCWPGARPMLERNDPVRRIGG